MDYKRMPIEIESPEELGYDTIECNLAESSVKDALFGDFKNIDLSTLTLSYGNHKGHPELRNAIAHEAGVSADDVLLVPGAAAGLFIIATSLLKKDDELVVVHPNYATNLETPEAIGAKIRRVNLNFDEGFRTTAYKLKKQLSHYTKYVSITSPHNPTGVMLSENELSEIINLVCNENDKYLLIDETYRYLSFSPVHAVGAGLHEKVISVSSMSKAFGLPGIRMGWVITRDSMLKEKFLAAKEQIIICNSVIDEEIAWQAFINRDEFLKPIRVRVEENFNVISKWLEGHSYLENIKPEGGVVCFPRIKNPSEIDIAKFYKILSEKYKTMVGPGHWFGMPNSYMRVGFGWPDKKELIKGLDRIDKSLHESFIS